MEHVRQCNQRTGHRAEDGLQRNGRKLLEAQNL